MRLVLIGPVHPYRGGIAHYTTMLCQALRQEGHQVLMVSFKRQYPDWLFPGKNDRDPSVLYPSTEDAHFWIDSLNPLTWFAAFRRIRAYRPDAIVLQWWTTFWAPAWFLLGALNRLLLQRPLVVLCHNVLPHESRFWDPWLVRATLRWGTAFITQSEEERERLIGLMPRARVRVCAHPVYDMFAGQKMSRQESRRQLGLPEDVPVLLFFGIIREYKGLNDALLALPAIRDRLGRVLLVVAGEFWDRKQPYLDTIRQQGIEDLVLFEDRYVPNEKVCVYFSAADVLVAPYRQVTGSGSVQMARGFELPVVTTTVGGLSGTIDGSLGLVVPPGSPQALAAALIRYFEENLGPGLTAQIRAQQERFSWRHLVVAVEALVQESLP